MSNVVYLITSPLPNYTGKGAGKLIFTKGYALCKSPWVADWHMKKGYKVEMLNATDLQMPTGDILFHLGNENVNELIENGKITANMASATRPLTLTAVDNCILKLETRTEGTNGNAYFQLQNAFQLFEDSEIEVIAKGAGIFYTKGKFNIYDATIEAIDWDTPQYSVDLETLQIPLFYEYNGTKFELPILHTKHKFNLPKGKYKFAYQAWNATTGRWNVILLLQELTILKKLNQKGV